jgi:hypothetical protein
VANGPGGSGQDQPAGGGTGDRARDQVVAWLVRAVPAVAASVGFLGFVAVLGAAIVWTRFTAAHLPADQATSKFPKSDLVAIGAVSLVSFLVLGLLAVLLVYLLQSWLLPSSRAYRQSVDRIRDLEGDLATARRRAESITADLTAAQSVSDTETFPARDSLRAGRQRAWAEVAGLQAKLATLRKAEQRAHEQGVPMPKVPNQVGVLILGAVEIAIAISISDSQTGAKAALVALVLGGAAVVVYAWWNGPKERRANNLFLIAPPADAVPGAAGQRTAQLVGIVAPAAVIAAVMHDRLLLLAAATTAVLLGGANLAIGRIHPRRFFWYGFAIFASVALYGAALEGIRTLRDPSVQPMAVLLKNGQVVRALYVTETKDRLYAARVDVNADGGFSQHSGRLFWFPRADVQNYSVGPLVHGGDVAGRQAALGDELGRPDIKPQTPPAARPK